MERIHFENPQLNASHDSVACPYCAHPIAPHEIETHILANHPNAGSAREIRNRQQVADVNTDGYQNRGMDDMIDA